MVYLHTGPMGVHRACFFIARAGRAATPERNRSGNQPPILCILPLVAHQLASARQKCRRPDTRHFFNTCNPVGSEQFNYRVKGTEKSWLLENAESILQVRAALLSEDERLERHMDGRMCLPFRRYKRDTDEGKAA